MTRTLPPSPIPTRGQSPPTPAISRRLGLGAAGCAVAGGILAVAVGPLIALAAIGVLILIGLFATAVYRPVFATYAYLGTLPLIAGIERGNLIPLVRPNEALLVVLIAGALVGGYLQWCRGERVPFQLNQLDIPLGFFLLMSTAWPLLSMMLRGQIPLTSDLAAVLPVCKLVAIYLLVRFSVSTQPQLMRCFRLIIWPGAVVAVIAILQTLHFGPVISMLQAVWTPESNAAALLSGAEPRSACPWRPVMNLVVGRTRPPCCGTRGRGRRERLALERVARWEASSPPASSPPRSARWSWGRPRGASASCAATPFGFCRWFLSRFPSPRRRWSDGRRASAGCACHAAGPVARATCLPLPTAVRFINVRSGCRRLGVPAPERWRDVIYLESGDLKLSSIGEVPLLPAFGWLSVVVLRRTAAHRPVGRTVERSDHARPRRPRRCGFLVVHGHPHRPRSASDG